MFGIFQLISYYMTIVICLLVFLLPNIANAYLDPGTGSVIIQALIAAVLGAAFTLKMYWRRFKDFLTGRNKNRDDDSNSK